MNFLQKIKIDITNNNFFKSVKGKVHVSLYNIDTIVNALKNCYFSICEKKIYFIKDISNVIAQIYIYQ